MMALGLVVLIGLGGDIFAGGEGDVDVVVW